jgi:choline kinase
MGDTLMAIDPVTGALIAKAVIPIAGYGTRLFPATKAIPKALYSYSGS